MITSLPTSKNLYQKYNRPVLLHDAEKLNWFKDAISKIKLNMEKYNFFPYSWHKDNNEEEITSIRAYGLNEKNENVCVRVDDFTPYVYIELPDCIKWDTGKAQLVGNKLDELLRNQKPLKKVLMMKKKLYGAHLDAKYNRKLFPYLFCSFSHRRDAKALEYRLRRSIHIVGLGALKLKIHESNADEILQLICCRKISTAGWIEFHGKRQKDDEKLTLCHHEFKVKWKHLSPLDIDKVAKPLIMGFDIEVNSTNPSAMPQSHRPGDKVFQISCVLSRYGDGVDKWGKFLLTLGEPNPTVVGDDVTIYMYETEASLLEGFRDFIREENPNLIVGYNILCFDIPYMIDRAKFNMCIFNFDQQGFHKFAHAPEETIKWSSSAYKNQEFQFLDAEGRVYVDLLPLIKRDYKLNNYKLKTIAEYFIGESKDDLSPKGIFKCYRIGIRSSADGSYSKMAQKAMGIVGKYCVQDSMLVCLLMEKLQTWIGLTEMANICNVPIFALYTKGQQIKVFSALYKYCMYENIVVEKDGYQVSEDERYVGAHVFPPVPGRYKKVVPFDFASLYPTTIIGYNIDYFTWVQDDSGIPDEKCHVMEWEDHIGCQHDPKVIRKGELTAYIEKEKAKIKQMREKRVSTSGKVRKAEMMEDIKAEVEKLKPYIKERSELNKSKPKFPMCTKRYYRFLKEPRGVLPTVIQNLLDARKHTRKVDMIAAKNKIAELEHDAGENGTDNSKEIEQLKGLLGVLDKRQLAYKVSANSVGGVTPIPCKISNNFVYRTIEELSQGDWKRVNDEQEISTPIPGISVWSDKGFTKPKYIMRHPTEKPLRRIITHTGFVDCTEDHSLLKPDGTEVKPSEVCIGEDLLHCAYPLPDDTPGEPQFRTITEETIQDYSLETRDEELAFVHGLFFAEGTSGTWGSLGNAKSSWIIYNQNLKLLIRARDILNKYEGKFIVTKYYESARVYHLKPVNTIKSLCDIYRELFYDSRKYKRIPDYVLTAPLSVRQAFFMGYYSGDGNRHLNIGVVISNKGQIGTASLMYLANSLGYNVSISNGKNNDVYRLQCSEQFRGNNTMEIKTIRDAPGYEPICRIQQEYHEYVYDIETENHHFAAGIGHMIVHNSMYGAMGVRKGTLPFMPGAMCTTYMGRKNIELTADTIVKKFKGELVYGDTDSLIGDTPILVKFVDGTIAYKTIDDISCGIWKLTDADKEISDPITGLQVWSDTGFTEINYVMRHAVEKPLIKVTTHTGSVVCTLDHSLLWEDGEPAKGIDVKVGDALCTSEFPLPDDTPIIPLFGNKLTMDKIAEYVIPDFEQNRISAKLAFVLGLFYADGSCGIYIPTNGYEKFTWVINNQDRDLLNRCLDILNNAYDNISFTILETMKSPGALKLVPKMNIRKHDGTIPDFVIAMRDMFYDNKANKKVPDVILNSDLPIRQAFFLGYYAGDGSKKDPDISSTNKGDIGAAGLFFLMRSIGYNVSINTRADKPTTYKLTGSTPMKRFRRAPNVVKKIEPYICEDNYVYDIETANHHFAAGVGQLVVHNSNYINFPHMEGNSDEELWAYSEYVADEVSKLFPPPMKLEFEGEIYTFFFILTKKRYMYRKVIKNKHGELIYSNSIGKKGVLLARRDNSKLIRDVYEGVINRIADDVPRDEIIYWILQQLNDMFCGHKPHDDFIVTKAVGDSGGLQAQPFTNDKGQKKAKVGDYTTPILSNDKSEREDQLNAKGAKNASEFYLLCLPAQVQLAERIRSRGHRVDPGTRLEYVVTDPDRHMAKQYEKIESADYYIKHSSVIKIDYYYYLKALINPLDQVLNVAFNKDSDWIQDFILHQHKFRWKYRHKCLQQIRSLANTRIRFLEN